MLVGFWLPWADVRCAQIRTEPDFWQLARYDERLYALLALAAILGLGGALALWRFRRKLAAVTAACSLAAALAWCYLWYKKDELAAYQAELASGGGDLGRMLQDLQVKTGPGFKLYLAGALLALAGALLGLARSESDSPR
jgi:hypothetical protein